MAIFKKSMFLESEAGVSARLVLEEMASDPNYHTEPSFSVNISKYPDSLMPFVDKHLLYLQQHPSVNPTHYLANLRLMTKKR